MQRAWSVAGMHLLHQTLAALLPVGGNLIRQCISPFLGLLGDHVAGFFMSNEPYGHPYRNGS